MAQARGWMLVSFGVVLGFLGGVGATLAVVGGRPTLPEPPPGPAPAPVATEQQEPVEPQPDPEQDEVLAKLAAASDPLAGPAPDWSPGPGYQPAAVRASLEAAFAGTDITLDCREFPCVGVIEAGPELPAELARDLDAHGFPRDAYREVGDQLSSLGLEDQSLAVHQAALDGGGYRILVAWVGKERDPELGPRLQARIDWLAEHGASSASGE